MNKYNHPERVSIVRFNVLVQPGKVDSSTLGQPAVKKKQEQAVGNPYLNCKERGAWMAWSVEPLPLAQAMIPGSWDGAPHWVPCSAESLLLPLPLPITLPACALSQSFSLSNK